MKLAAIGQALYGPRWQSELARALGVTDRQVRRWVAAGTLPEAYLPAVRCLIAERVRLLRSLR
jgi:hypothetical protein